MKTAKFAGPAVKLKRLKKMHITRKEYRKTTAVSVDKSLDQMFKG